MELGRGELPVKMRRHRHALKYILRVARSGQLSCCCRAISWVSSTGASQWPTVTVVPLQVSGAAGSRILQLHLGSHQSKYNVVLERVQNFAGRLATKRWRSEPAAGFGTG